MLREALLRVADSFFCHIILVGSQRQRMNKKEKIRNARVRQAVKRKGNKQTPEQSLLINKRAAALHCRRGSRFAALFVLIGAQLVPFLCSFDS